LPLISRATAAELTTILAYSKFRLSVDEQFEALDSYILSCEIVEITQVCPVLCRAPKDQPFLDLAHSGKAEVLVTGDADLLALIGETEFVIETPEAYRQRVIVYE
jgi:putative PIN family toxin of toxin-antitoxin system